MSFDEYLRKFIDLRDLLKFLDNRWQDSFWKHCFLVGLDSDRFRSIKTSILFHDTSPTLLDVITQVNTYVLEKKLKNPNWETTIEAIPESEAEQNLSGESSRKRSRDQNRDAKHCDHCQEKFPHLPQRSVGHTVDSCWDKFPERRPKHWRG
jgi:hypothetical protein